MFFTPIYQQLKTRLSQLPVIAGAVQIPMFFYIGQYLPGKENTSYKVPAIYFDFPDNSNIEFKPQKLMSSKLNIIKIHYISYAPFKNHDNEVQDAEVLAHDAMLKQIDLLLNGWHAVDANGLKLTEQFLTKGGSFLQYKRMCLVSVINYQTEIFSRHLKV